MQNINLSDLSSLPFIPRGQANEIALKYLNGEYFLETILSYLAFFDSTISDKIFNKAIEQDANAEILVQAINPLTNRNHNDTATLKAIEKEINIELLAGKVFPFVSMDVANKVAQFSMMKECNCEILINAALPFVSIKTLEEIISYAINRKVSLVFLKERAATCGNPGISSLIMNYVNDSGQSSDKNNTSVNTIETISNKTSNFDKMKQILNESGINFNDSQYDESLELDSLHYISIICEIENEFNVDIPDEVLSNNSLSTFNDFLRLIDDLRRDV